MNTLKFQINPPGRNENFPNKKTVSIFIDGNDLLEKLKKIELEFVQQKGLSGMEGNHCDLRLDQFKKEFLNTKANKKVLYNCPCGESECWPLALEIYEENDIIIWKNFQSWHEDLKYELEFKFDKDQFQKELSKLKDVEI
jgi:hypothetical protein